MQLTTTRKEASDYDTIEKPQPHTTRVFWISHTLEERMEMRESVSGGGREGGAVKDIFTGKEGKSGTARAAAVNVVRTISTIIRRLLVERNEGHLFRMISSFTTLINHRRSLDRNSRVEADGTKESVLER